MISFSASLSKLTSSPPSVLENVISSRLVIIPPAEISCPAKIRPLFISSCIVSKAVTKYSVSLIIGASRPILFNDWANAEPPNLKLSNEKSM